MVVPWRHFDEAEYRYRLSGAGESTGRRPLAANPAGEAHTLVILEDSPEPALIMFVVEGGLVYLDKPVDGGFAAYEDGFTLLELTRDDYRDAGLDVREIDGLVR